MRIKKLKLLKRILSLILVLFLCIENFAAVVSDNDGSAFITKAEFDSLKNSFQAQIDQYNTSIDSKIDGAIAAYLAGVKVEAVSVKTIFARNWSDYTIVNGGFAQTYQYPDFSNSIGIFNYRFNDSAKYGDPLGNLVIGANLSSTYLNGDIASADVIAKGGSQTAKQLWAYAAFKWENSKTNNYRNLVENVIIGETPNVNNMTWAGRATNVTESWANNRLVYDSADPAFMNDSTAAKQKFCICNPLRIAVDGYISSFTDACRTSDDGEFLWRPSVEWDYQSGSNVGTDNYSKLNWGYGQIAISASSIPSIKYDVDSNGNDIINRYIGDYKASTSWEVTAKNVTNYALFSSHNTLRIKGWLDKASSETSISGKWSGHEIQSVVNRPKRGASNIQAWRTDQPVEFTDRNAGTSTDGNHQIPVVGLLGDFNASSIYQYKDGDLVDDDGENISPLKLHQGLPLMQVKESEKIEWTPVFNKVSVNGATSVNECKVILSYRPFTDLTNVTDTKDYVKIDGIERGNFAETTDKKVTIKFEAEKDGYIYVKWVPKASDTIINNNNWEICLDISKCRTYKSTRE